MFVLPTESTELVTTGAWPSDADLGRIVIALLGLCWVELEPSKRSVFDMRRPSATAVSAVI